MTSLWSLRTKTTINSLWPVFKRSLKPYHVWINHTVLETLDAFTKEKLFPPFFLSCDIFKQYPQGKSLQMDLCSFDELWQNPKNVLAEMSLLVLEARTAACRLHLSRTWLIMMQKSAQSLKTSLEFDSKYLRMAAELSPISTGKD